MNPPNSMPPNRICSRGSSLLSSAKTSDTKNANSARSRRWLLHHFRPIAMS